MTKAVDWTDAMPMWTQTAREVLIERARSYRAVITYKELGEIIFERSGITTDAVLRNWIGKVLDAVNEECRAAGEPMLSSLCTRSDGTMGEGYATGVKTVYDESPGDFEQHAASERLKCHRYFGAPLPADGGRPALTARVAARRAALAKAIADEAPPVLCPSCFTVLPSNGKCDYC